MPIDPLFGRRSRPNLAEMTISVTMINTGYSADTIRALFKAFPAGRMKQIREDILAGRFAPWPGHDATMLDDDFSTNGGDE